MAKDNRRVITWTHIESNSNYRNSIEKFNHKIYSIGIHEFGVRSSGKIYDYNSGKDYFDASGNHTGVRFPVLIEEDIINYQSIKWYLQMILFGWSTVKPVLDNNVTNAEGRLPQDQFVYELNMILDLYQTSRSSGTPLNLAGVEMDVEASMTDDPYTNGADTKYIRFLEKIKNEVIIPRQMKMRINAHAMWGDNVPYYYRFHNYKLFAASTDKNGNAMIDEIQLMTYDYSWNGSSAGASTPIWWFKNVAAWCVECFEPTKNPNAKLTIENLYFGAAGYGHRWGMYDQEVVKSGSNITYHQLLGWQNGQYKHYHTETDANGQTVYVYHNQPYLFQASFQDDESKNEILYPHVYDMFVPKYAKVKEQDGGNKTAVVGTFNRNDYAASYFKQQIPIWTNVHDVANIPSSVSGKAFALPIPDNLRKETSNPIYYPQLRQYDPILDPNDVNFKHAVKTVDGVDYPFVQYTTYDRIWKPNKEGTACVLEDEPEGRFTYTVNVPSAGNYRVIALTNFSWYTQAKLGGYINGQQFTVGDNLPEWYPFFLKGSHWFDCGSFSLNAGNNTISVYGELSDEGTPIYGFVVCDAFNPNFSGGELTFSTNIQPMTGKDGNPVPIPKTFALAAKMLRRDARPAILWDDEFRTYNEGTILSGNSDPTLDTTYYRQAQIGFTIKGGGTDMVQTGTQNGVPTFDCRSTPRNVGYSQGYWTQKNYRLHFDTNEMVNVYDDLGNVIGQVKANAASSGQCVLSKQWTVNLSIEADIEIVSGAQAGIRFYAQSQGTVADGYVFRVDMKRGVRELVFEDYATKTSKVVASQPIGNVGYGTETTFKALLHNGVGQFFIGGVQAFVAGDNNQVTHDGSVDTATGKVTLTRRSGAVGIYANNSEIYCSHLGIGTTDRWETLEKFEVVVDGSTREFGRINRTGYSYDEFGYLIYSGLNEKSIRDSTQYPFEEDATAVSLDYEVTVFDWTSWQGRKDVKIKLRDAGVWFGELLIGDKEGMSVIWAGDAWSFLDAMNMAVNDYGAKGIGLWAMGQEDPKVWELVPDVVPKK
jgi:spore germination protein YaaH